MSLAFVLFYHTYLSSIDILLVRVCRIQLAISNGYKVCWQILLYIEVGNLIEFSVFLYLTIA